MCFAVLGCSFQGRLLGSNRQLSQGLHTWFQDSCWGDPLPLHWKNNTMQGSTAFLLDTGAFSLAADLTVKFPGGGLHQASRESGVGASFLGQLGLEMAPLPLPSPQSALSRLRSERKAVGSPISDWRTAFLSGELTAHRGSEPHLCLINTVF